MSQDKKWNSPHKRLKYARKKLGITQEKCAISIGLNRFNITDLETGKVKISTLHALALEYIYKINSKWLLNAEGEVFIKNEKTEEIEQSDNVIEIKHMNLVKKFKDKEAAKEANEQLIELEEINQDAFYNTTSFIKGALQTAKVMLRKDGVKDEGLGGKVKDKKKA
jgi:transcriptional regulator with XRE-family HTH domain